MYRLTILVIAVLCLNSVYAKDEIKDAVVKKADKVETPAVVPQQQQPKAVASSQIGAGTSGFNCYQCNSGTAGQEDCALNDPEALAKFIKPCPLSPEGSSLEGINGAKACRKIEQNVDEDPTRVIRECSYTDTEELNGKKRTGNKGIFNYLYVCFNEDSDAPCNPASQTVISIGAMISFVIVQIYQRL